LHTFNSNLTYGYIIRIYRSSLTLVMVRWILTELCPLMKFSVSVHYLLNIQHSHSTRIWHMNTSTKAQVKFKFDHDFLQKNAHWTLKNNQKFLVSVHFLPKLKFDIWICQRNAQAKFKFGYGLMNFGSVMPLSLLNKNWSNRVMLPE
jgi:hypothetical protein